MIKVIKRDGREVEFNKNKIYVAILQAMKYGSGIVNEKIAKDIANEFKPTKNTTIYKIENYVYDSLIKKNQLLTAKAYEGYRAVQGFKRKNNTTDNDILNLIKQTNKEVMEENSNKDPKIASTQRDLIAGEVSKDISRRKLLPTRIVQAHDDGIIHFHDMDYFMQPIHNCDLINIQDMLDNGTVINGKMIESPKSFQVACTVVTQIIAQVASGQYGGQSINIKHLGKYVRVSYNKYLKKYKQKYKESVAVSLAKDRLRDEIAAGVQTIQYQINTLMTTNGQSPFVTLFLDIEPNHPYEYEISLIVEEIIKQRILGIKNEKGVYVTPSFPKLIYVLYEHNNLMNNGKYDHITKLCAKCSAKRLYPDYISSKKMKEIYEGNVFSCMGCVDGQEIITYKYKNLLYIESFARMWNRLSEDFTIKEQNTNKQDFYMDLKDVQIYDTMKGFVNTYRIIKNEDRGNWIRVKFSNGRSLLATSDHPLPIINKGRTFVSDLTIGDKVYTRKSNELNTAKVTNLEYLGYLNKYSYDVTTESDHFEVSGIYSHNCRSFLSPWKDENGNYKFEGRFNQGVVTLNLPQIGIIAKGDFDKFWELMDTRLDLCFEALMCRHNALLGTPSDISPIHWQYGALARLKKGETIDKLLNNGYSTISLGYIGLYEVTKLMTGESHTTDKGLKFALQVMKRLRKATDTWKKDTGIGFGLYGSPAESTCYRLAKIDKAKFGVIKDITDKGYYTNSYHVDVREHIDAFAKLEFESQFQEISTGGCISYIEIPNMLNNVEALENLIKFIYDHIQYAEFNTKSDYCHKCGYSGEIVINDDLEWECPNCHNKDQNEMTVTRRTCGYLGDNFWNVGKTKEIKARVLHL